MRPPLRFAALSAVLLASCTSKLVVLDPELSSDAGRFDGGRVDAAPQRDGESTRVEAGAEESGPDGALESDAAAPGEAGDGGALDELSSFRSVAAFGHSCAVHGEQLLCWGDNRAGQVGHAGAEWLDRPELLAPGSFVSLCAGEVHACALTSAGMLTCWGDNQRGELGLGDRLGRAEPTPLPNARFRRVACGGRSSCAIDMEGDLFCWGDNSEGKLGRARLSEDALVPTLVSSELRFAEVSVGQGHVCALTDLGALYCWGRNTEAQLGTDMPAIQLRTPEPVMPSRRFVAVSAAQQHSCAIDRLGALYCWGDNREGLLATGPLELVRTPLQVGSELDYRAIAAGWFHNCALRAGGELSCWGRNVEGQLGLDDAMNRAVPTRVGGESGWSAVAVGHFHSCGIREGALFCWGVNDRGQLGLGDLARRYTPARVSFLGR